MQVRINRLLSVQISFYQKMLAFIVNNSTYNCENFIIINRLTRSAEKFIQKRRLM